MTCALALTVARAAEAGPVSLPDFAIENAYPGVAFILPTAMAFTPDGRLLVAEKRGEVWVVDRGARQAQPMWNAEAEVLADGDRGLVGIAVDPGYAVNHRVYFYYTVDPDSDGVDDNMAAFTRLVRYETSAADSNVVDPATRTVLIGRTWSDGILSPTLSHAVDCLRFGADGSLLLSHGDGSHVDKPDPGGLDPDQFLPGRTDPIEDIGAFRAQFIDSPGGKLLRINPENGHGYATNPYAGGDLTQTRAKVWAYGLRNPFRLLLRPGTGSPDTAAGNPGVIYVADVGAATYEELDVVDRPGKNFGWPCFEGPGSYATLAGAAPAHHGCASLGTSDNPALPTAPSFYWHHADSTRSMPWGIRGNCTSGGVFYDGARYPAHYRGRLFFGDFGGGWLRVATLDSSNAILQVQEFASGLAGPVDWARDPVSDELFYVSLYTGEVRRIHYVGGTGGLPLVAQASATTIAAPSPASIQFSSLGSYDPAGSALSYAWSFGDGTPGSSAAQPAHVYAAAGEYTAILTVSSGLGEIARDTVHVVVVAGSGFPVTGVIDAFHRADGPLGSPWAGNLAGLAIRDSALVHNGTTDNYAIWNGGSFGANQEVHMRFDSLSAAAKEHDLLLKVQGTSWANGAIHVVYGVATSVVLVSTYAPGTGWTQIAGPWRGIRFEPGDTFGARAYSNGWLEVYRNGTKLGDCHVDTWPFSSGGGRVGLLMRAAQGSRFTDFGGGDVPVRDNIPPVARIVSPIDGSFFATGDHIFLRGSGTDAEDPPSSLRYAWSVSLRHNNHIHPDIHTFSAAVDSFEAEDHDDGTGTSLIIRLAVIDSRGAADSASVEIHPDVDLTPTPITTMPEFADGSPLTTFRFWIANRARMRAPRSHWQLRANGTVITEGDTIVDIGDSVLVQTSLPSLPGANNELSAEVDARHEVWETDETNNLTSRKWGVRPFPTSRVLDGFDRANGPVGSPWLGSTSGLAIDDHALTQTAPIAYAVWNGAVFGPDQEAFVRFDAVTADAPEQTVLLKSQRTSWNGGTISVSYSARTASLSIGTYSPTAGWVKRGGPWRNVSFAPGDQLGARASASGMVTAYKNGVAIGSASVAGWEFAGRGGRVGVLLRGASTTRLLDFGGGDVTSTMGTPPEAVILEPSTGSIQPAGDRIGLRGRGTDAEDPASELRYRWRIELPSGVRSSFAAADSFPMPTVAGAPVAIRLVVTDKSGRCDTAFATVHSGTGTLDRFDRADGAPGASWSGMTTAFAIRKQALVSTGASAYLMWNGGAWGADQEAWMQLDSVTATAPEHDLLLKSQGPSWTAGVISVAYSATQSQIVVGTYTPGVGWKQRGGPWHGITLAPGDRFGARAFADGRVQVFRNGLLLCETSVAGWPYATSGGRIGLILSGATQTRIGRFGGGTLPEATSVRTSALEPAAPKRSFDAAASLGEPWVSRAMPNPVTYDASFMLALPRPAQVELEIYDMQGREVFREPRREYAAGPVTLRWSGADRRGVHASTGVYLARVTIDGARFLRRLTILR